MSNLEAFVVCMAFGVLLSSIVLCVYEGLELIDGPGSLINKLLERPAEFIMKLADKWRDLA